MVEGEKNMSGGVQADGSRHRCCVGAGGRQQTGREGQAGQGVGPGGAGGAAGPGHNPPPAAPACPSRPVCCLVFGISRSAFGLPVGLMLGLIPMFCSSLSLFIGRRLLFLLNI